MPVRKIIHIDDAKCDGCGLCVDACHEGAIQLVAGKARLVSDSYCDGLGDCLAECPQGAITIIEREAGDYDEEAVQARMHERKGHAATPAHTATPVRATPAPCACPGAMARSLETASAGNGTTEDEPAIPAQTSQLATWPVQLHLVPPSAPYLREADLLISADCVGFAVPDFHARYLRQRPIVIACPKLDDVSPYVGKLTQILSHNNIRRVTVLRMQVPCCGGLTRLLAMAVAQATHDVTVDEIVIGVNGQPLGPPRALQPA